MHKTNFMKKIVLILFLIISFIATKASDTIAINLAVVKGLIQFSATAKGGYTGNVLSVDVKNNSANAIFLSIPAGHIFDSEEEGEQDLLVTQSYLVKLEPAKKQILNIFSMCCQALKSSPKKGNKYKVGKLSENKNLVKLANFIEKYKYNDFYPAQQAVWVLSNGNRLETISGEPELQVKNIKYYLTTLGIKDEAGKPIQMPWYEINFKDGDSTSVFSNKATKITGEFNYYLQNNANVILGIYTPQGKIVKLYINNDMQDPGHKSYPFIWKVDGLQAGTYLMRVYGDNQLKKEAKIIF